MAGIEELLTGRKLADRYRIEEVIGRGGMGAVYRALDERLGREVALKVITLTVEDREERRRLRARFHREARAAARIDHPNVATVYDFATDPELKLDFLVMELLRGEDLAAHLEREGRPPLPLALRILRDAGQGLAAGHRLGMVHRDVKPGNIFLAESATEQGLRVAILDFGIAKLTTDEDTLSQLTQDGRTPLSPAYASPEQLRNEKQLTPASDVFSLGVIGFELLTGSRLFDAHDLARGSTPIPPPKIQVLNPDVPAEVDEVLRRALAHEPQDRFPDAGAFVQALAPRPEDATEAIPAAVPAAALSLGASHPHLPPKPEDATEAMLTADAPASVANTGLAGVSRARAMIPVLALVLLVLSALGAAALLGRNGEPEGALNPVPAMAEEQSVPAAAEEPEPTRESTAASSSSSPPPAAAPARTPQGGAKNVKAPKERGQGKAKGRGKGKG